MATTILILFSTYGIQKALNMVCLTGLLVKSENLMWKSSLDSPGMDGVNTTSSLMLSKGPIFPSLS